MVYLASIAVIGVVLGVLFREGSSVRDYFFREAIESKGELEIVEAVNRKYRGNAEQMSEEVVQRAVEEYWRNDGQYEQSRALKEAVSYSDVSEGKLARIVVLEDRIQVFSGEGGTPTNEIWFVNYKEKEATEPTRRCAYVYAWLDDMEESFYASHDRNRYKTATRSLDFSFVPAQHNMSYMPYRNMTENVEVAVLEDEYIAGAAEGRVRFIERV